jgi:hypothetical protein
MLFSIGYTLPYDRSGVIFSLSQVQNFLGDIMLFSIGYTLPYDRSGVIFSLSQVQNFLGDEGDCSPPSNRQIERGTSPFWKPPDVSFGVGLPQKSGQGVYIGKGSTRPYTNSAWVNSAQVNSALYKKHTLGYRLFRLFS